MVELVRDIAEERRGDSRVLQGHNALLVYDFLNLGGVGLERLKVSVLGENLYPVVALSTPCIPSTLRVQLVHPVNG